MANISSSYLKVLATAAIGGLALAGCSSPEQQQDEATGEPQSGGTLIYASGDAEPDRSEEHTSELQSRFDLVCRLLLEKIKSKLLQLLLKISLYYYLHCISCLKTTIH